MARMKSLLAGLLTSLVVATGSGNAQYVGPTVKAASSVAEILKNPASASADGAFRKLAHVIDG